ncbi:MAG: serine/threonine protein kinase [Alphaproteobacteria bacterium]|nr:serine/threonine protein kinase [Alphaproteobacteria bacterium]
MQPGTRFGRFEVQQTLGQGGIAMVYRVRHVQLDSVLALKVLRVGEPSTYRRLLQEGRIQARLKHENVVQVLDVVEHEGGIGLLMEYVDGFSLDDCLRDGVMDLPEALEIFEQVLAGVAAAHAQGVTHRDLKPGNILLTTRGDRVLAKVTDFGIAKVFSDEALGGRATRAGVTMGTPGYMAPEQIIDSSAVDLRADIFALGAILYEMVSGHRPFEGGTPLDILNATARGEFDPLDELVPTLPARVVRAVHRALAREREERFASVDELAEALFDDTSFLRHTVPAPPPSLSESIDDLPTDLGAPTLAPQTELPSQETWLPRAFGTQAEDTEETDALDLPEPARPAGEGLGYEVVEEERSARDGTLGAQGSVAPKAEEEAGETGSDEDDPDSDVNAKDAAEMMSDLLWSFLRATAWGIAQTARYAGIPIVLVFAIGAWVGSTTASELEALADSRRIAAESLSNAMDSSVRLVPEVIAGGGNAELLRRLQRDYEQAVTPEEKAAAARELSTALSQEIARLPPPQDEDQERRRKEIGLIINRLDREAVEYGEVNERYESMAGSARGTLAKAVGWF